MPAIPKPILTFDIVGFSLMSGQDQMVAVRVLIQLLRRAIPPQHNHPMKRIWSPGGDGGSLTFLDDIFVALKTAVELAKLVDLYNKGELKLYDAEYGTGELDPEGSGGRRLCFLHPRRGESAVREQPLQLRMGLHCGPVASEIDFDNRENVWGSGMNVSARVANLARPGQIVASEEYYRLAELEYHAEYEVTWLDRWWTKHHQSLVLYNIYDPAGAGIPGSSVQGWYDPLQYPWREAIGVYEAMLEELLAGKSTAFRIAVVAKRLLDLDPEHRRARAVLASISETQHRATMGDQVVHDVLLSHLSPGALTYLFTKATFQDFRAGQVICEEGQEATYLMVVVAGAIEISVQRQKLDLLFQERDIIGEMGLFNPAGRIRTATLRAWRDSAVLSLHYDFLSAENGQVGEWSEEIRKQLWMYSRDRTEQNFVYSHPLFRHLPEAQKDAFARHCTFRPERYHEPITLDVQDLRDHWAFVVQGSATVHTPDEREIEFKEGGCVGLVLLTSRDDDPTSYYRQIELHPDTQLITFPRSIIDGYVDSCREFRRDWLEECYDQKLQLAGASPQNG